ncbi:MAG: DUF6273 domain-containing protein [Lachnospiraceae bacterium]|nr:DUF6273 domain-containing protein [Lachnospiraceae bacterium]
MEETFVFVEGYDNDNDFVDEYIVDIDFKKKEIGEIGEQVLVAGENKSQYIGFEADRYYDGIDLSTKSIHFIYVGTTGYSDIERAINVSRSENKIRFAFLVPGEALMEIGEMMFCADFIGPNYSLKTVPKTVEVKEGLTGSEIVERPAEKIWYQEMEALWAETQQNASEAAEAVKTTTKNASDAAADARTAREQANAAAESAETSARSSAAAAEYLRNLLDKYPTSYVADVEATDGGIRIKYASGDSEVIPVAASGGLSFDGGYQDEEGYLHLTKDGEEIEGFDPIKIAGGGGGGGTGGSRITFASYTAPTFSVMESSGTAPIRFKFTSVDVETGMETGAANIAIAVGGSVRANKTIQQGDDITVDPFPYLTNGSNTVKLTITDSYGSIASRTFTITMENFGLEWSLGNTYKNTEATLGFYVTPTGSGSKVIYTYVDGTLYSTDNVSTSGRRMTKTITGLTHGMHFIEVYGLMDVGGSSLESQHLTCAVAQIGSSAVPVVAVDWPVGSMTQYTNIQIPYMVVDPGNNPADVQFTVNGVIQSSVRVDQAEQIWSYRPVMSGKVTLGIMCGSTISQKELTINSIGSDVEEITDGLAIKVDPSVITDLRSWSYGDYRFSMSENFDFTNGGLQVDENGVHCIRITAGDRLTLNYPLFSGDARRTGKEAKIVYRVANSSNKEAEAISCMDSGIGLQAFANNVYLRGDQTTVTLSVCEDMKTELDINIEQDSEDRLMYMWEKCSTFAFGKYATNESFTHATAKGITFGSDDADVYLYLFRAYTRDLTEDELKANYIHDGADGDEIRDRQNRNDIYDGAGKPDPELVAEKNPNAHVIIVDAPRMTVGKKDTVVGAIRHIYTGGGAEHRFSAPMEMVVQGTSSVEHAETAGGNLKFKLKQGITLEDGTHKGGYAMNGEDKSVPITILNYKKNIASEDHIVNKAVSEWYQRYQPTVRQARKDDPRVRDCMESVMCVVFFHNTSENTVMVGPDTVQPDETVFFGIGNLCTDKDAENAYQYDPIVIEVKNNTEPSVRFKSGDMLTDFDTNFEFRYLNEDVFTEAQAKAKFQEMGAFVHATDWTEATNTALTRVVTIDGQAFSTDSAAYRKAKWKAEAPNYFDMQALYWHHNDTLFHLLRDNRAKNMFWSFAPSEGVWSLRFAWDHDTGHCRNNEGYYDMEPGYMDFDTIGTADVYNAADNVIFSNLRECNWDDLKAAYINRESAGAWNGDAFYDYCKQNQDYLCEALWIEDAMHNAIRVMQNLGTDAYLARATGKMQLHLKKSLKFQKALVDSYYCSTAATSDSASFRGYAPSEWRGIRPNGTVSVTMYTDIYVNVLAGSTAYRVRAKAGEPITIDISASLNDTEIYWRSAEWYQAFGSLAGLYLGQFEASKLKRVREILIGSDVDGYFNTNFTTGSFDNCLKLEKLNLGGLVNAKKAFDFSPNIYLKELYTKGSGVTGITFAKNGRLREAKLNAVASLFMSGLRLLEDFEMESYDKLASLTVEDSPAVDSFELVNTADNLARVRLLEIDWRVPVTAYDTLLRLKGIHGIDDDGYDVAEGVVTGAVFFQSVSRSKYDDIVSKMPAIEFTYGELLEEHTVTFQNDDGSVLFVAKVEHGGNLKDPVQAGLISAPSKESTVEYNFTYYKWDKSLEYIVSDMLVTATYTRTIRTNTVRFFAPNRTTVLETYVVGAHGNCAYAGEDLKQSGYVWIGWDKDTSDVVEDMDVYPVMMYPAMPAEVKDISKYDYAYSDDPNDRAAYTFSEFYAICKTGQALDYFPVTTRIKMKVNTPVIADTDIVLSLHATDQYELVSGGRSNVVFYMVGVLNANRQMNSTNTNVGGWDKSAMRTWLNDVLFKELDPKWRNFIEKAVTLASAGGTSANIVRSEDYLRLPSTSELGFDINAVPYKNETKTTEAGAAVPFSCYTDNNSRIKKTYNGTGAATNYWTRSAEAGGSSAFRNVTNYGNSNASNAGNGNGVCLGFCG